MQVRFSGHFEFDLRGIPPADRKAIEKRVTAIAYAYNALAHNDDEQADVYYQSPPSTKLVVETADNVSSKKKEKSISRPGRIREFLSLGKRRIPGVSNVVPQLGHNSITIGKELDGTPNPIDVRLLQYCKQLYRQFGRALPMTACPTPSPPFNPNTHEFKKLHPTVRKKWAEPFKFRPSINTPFSEN